MSVSSVFSRLSAIAVCAVALGLAGCSTPVEEKPTITVTLSTNALLANGENELTVDITGLNADGSLLAGPMFITTDRGTFQPDGNQSISETMVDGSLGPYTLRTCNSLLEPDCARSATITATMGLVIGQARVTFEQGEVDCEDGQDNDGDGDLDCADVDCDEVVLANGASCIAGFYDCPGGEAGTGEVTCGDTLDNDCDGVADCDDLDCETSACSANGDICEVATNLCVCNNDLVEGDSALDCYDAVDDDCDGDVDGADIDCFGRPCDNAGSRWGTDTGTGLTTCSCFVDQIAAESSCQDSFDNDCDGDFDCGDSDCNNAPCEDLSLAPNNVGLLCNSGVGACACPTDLGATGLEAACNDGVDNDCDGDIDCDDQNCNGSACGPSGLICANGQCECPGGTTESACGDSLDNDCDGLIDCLDPDCNASICGANGLSCSANVCQCPGAELNENTCGNSQDDDCDGSIDCNDGDCDTLACGSGQICQFSTTTCIIDPGFNRLTFTADRLIVLADGTSEIILTAHVENDLGAALAGESVDFAVLGGGIVQAAGATTFTDVTDASGNVFINWRPGTAPAKQLEGNATIDTDPGVPVVNVTKSIFVDVIGLDVITVDSIQYNPMGLFDSGWRETNQVVFRLAGTNSVDFGLSMPDGVTVDLTIDTTAGGLTLSMFSQVTAGLLGTVTTTAVAGTQVTSFTITASATVGVTTQTTVTTPINIVGAKPSHDGFTFSCQDRNINGLGAFAQDSDFNTTSVSLSVTCSAGLNDRFGNPILRPDILVKFLSEAGTMESDKPISNGISNTTFDPLGSLPYDTTPLAGEPSWVHTVGPITQTRNPRDGFVTLIAFISGEEAFTDSDGDGSYDLGEQFVDLSEPYIDSNDNGIYDIAFESFNDANNNGVFDGPNGVWDSQSTIWTETRIVISGCQYSHGADTGFLTSFGDLPDSGSASVNIRVADINMNSLKGGTTVSLRKVAPSPNKVILVFSLGGTTQTVPDAWGMAWGLAQVCTPSPCVIVPFIVPPTASNWGSMYGVSLSDSQQGDDVFCDTDDPCGVGESCVNNLCEEYESYLVELSTNPCLPRMVWTQGGTSN